MTLIAGILKAETSFGKSIRSGGAALLKLSDDAHSITALAEERATGRKYAGGFKSSLSEILASTGCSVEELDVVAASSCCEPQERALQGLPDFGPAKIISVGHHESHATLTFLGSGYDEALIAVSDGGGDVLDGYSGQRWWLHPREQLTFWHGTRSGGLQLICRDFASPLDTGFGEFYRAVSYFLGWHGSRHASKVMALAAYGERPPSWPGIFQLDGDSALRCNLENRPDSPIEMIIKLGEELGIDLGEPRQPNAEILEVHRNLAAWTQSELERAMSARLNFLLRQTGLRKVCLAGGVALNVVANGVFQKELGVPIYVPPAPADDGQALGNALSVWWNAFRERGNFSRFVISVSSHAELGPPRTLSSATVSDGLSKHSLESCTVFEYSSSAAVVARVLSAGSMVCVFQERSEYGPRALGSRSILGDPRLEDGRALFNQVKQRDWFMPFAPSVKRDSVGEIWFTASIDSPFMSFAVDFAPDRIDQVRAVSSNDGTGRVQSVAADEKSFIANVVREFNSITGVPMILNTSFNSGGQPIVETVDDALATFAKMPVNILALGRFLVVKSLSPELIDARVMPKQFPVDGAIVRNGERFDLGLSRLTSRECIRTVQKHSGLVVFIRSELPLFADFLERLRKSEKETTIRYRKGAVELPSFKELPLYETQDYGVGDRSRPTAVVEIRDVRYQIFGELTEDDAIADGFFSLEEMRRELKTIYKNLGDDEWVTIYSIGLKRDLTDETMTDSRRRPES